MPKLKEHSSRGRLIRLPAVLERTGLGKSKVYKDIKEGTFPAPVKLGSRNVALLILKNAAQKEALFLKIY